MAYDTIQDEGAPLPQQTVLDVLSAMAYAVDNPANNKTDLYIGVDALGTIRLAVDSASPHVTVTGDLHIPSGYLGIEDAPAAKEHIRVGRNNANGYIGVNINYGNTASAIAGTVKGIAGYALAVAGGASTSYGLDFIAGTNGKTITNATGARASIFTNGAGFTLTNAKLFECGVPVALFATITNTYGLYIPSFTVGTNRYAIYELGQPAGDNHGNRLKSNTMFASVVGSFAGGLGVVGIANAAVVPAGVPVAGGVLYNTAVGLYYLGQAGTLTLLAPS